MTRGALLIVVLMVALAMTRRRANDAAGGTVGIDPAPDWMRRGGTEYGGDPSAAGGGA